MTDILTAYTDLSSSTPRFQVSTVLQSIIDANPFTFDQYSRSALIRLLISDLRTTSSKRRLLHKDASQALLAVKTLGRIPAGSEPLTEASSISTLLELSTSLAKEDRRASSEALKCVANTMLLYDQARATFLSREVRGGEVCTALLEKATTPDQIFTLSRIMFLATVSPSPLILSLVEDKRRGRTIVDVITMKMDMILKALLTDKYLSRDAISELLKFTFNILLHYPKLYQMVSGNTQFQSPSLDGLLPPLLRVYQSLPPTFPLPLVPPLTHVIHALVTIPVTPSLLSLWLSSTHNSRSRTLSHLHSSNIKLSRDSPPRSGTLDRAFQQVRRSLSISSHSPTSMFGNSYEDITIRTIDLLDVVFSYHFPSISNPDARQVRESFKRDLTGSKMPKDTSLDELLSPLVTLCTRICTLDQTARLRVREWIVPVDLDRTNPLDERNDFLGRCTRLLRSVYHTRLKASIGEMLYAACDCDPSILSSLFGYGNVAGFLFNKGILSAPPPPSSDPHSSQRFVNPITGTFDASPLDTLGEIVEMTEEEKEKEMDRLFVLFDRLERSGAPPPNQRKTVQPKMKRTRTAE